jgi:ribokinase
MAAWQMHDDGIPEDGGAPAMITVFGSVNLDLLARVERLPAPGETVPGTEFATAPGGKGANQALAAARAGASVRLVAAVGRDASAAPAIALLDTAGIDLGALRSVDGPTGVALILVDGTGENVIAVIPGANASLSEADAALRFSAGDLLLLQLEVPVAPMAAAAERALAAGARVLLNFAPFRREAVELIRCATHLIVNEGEARLIAAALGISEPAGEDQLHALAAACGVTAVLTRGREGALAVEAGALLSVPALSVDAVDTVGAGDTFCGYFAAGLAEGLTLEPALALATMAASLACTRPGAQPAIPLRSEVAAAAGRRAAVPKSGGRPR